MVDYITVDEVKEDQPSNPWGSSYDKLIDTMIPAACRLMDQELLVKPGAYAVESETTRYFDGSGSSVQMVDPMADAPSEIAVNENGDLSTYTVWSATDYYLQPYNSTPYREIVIDLMNGTKAVWYRYPKAVKITAKFGISTEAPALVKRATIIQVHRWIQRATQGYEDVGALRDIGQLKYVKELDPDVKTILEGLREVAI
jgi:hypothetical protein